MHCLSTGVNLKATDVSHHMLMSPTSRSIAQEDLTHSASQSPRAGCNLKCLIVQLNLQDFSRLSKSKSVTLKMEKRVQLHNAYPSFTTNITHRRTSETHKKKDN